MTTSIFCKTCGSMDIRADADATWNGETWELNAVYDDRHCDSCGGHDLEEIDGEIREITHDGDRLHIVMKDGSEKEISS